MGAKLQAKLEKLNVDYQSIKGQSFSHFFCPILFRDDEVELCEGHIINQAFPKTSRAWIVQRKDVDNFYGQIESEFVALQYRDKTPVDMLLDKKLSRLFKPQIFDKNKPIDSFISSGNVPEKFTKLEIYSDNKVYLFGLKGISNPENVDLEIKIPPKDLRGPALISLIKSAHLTLFEIFGYEYALSAGGHFVGSNILGKFFVQNQHKEKAEILENAESFLANILVWCVLFSIQKLAFRVLLVISYGLYVTNTIVSPGHKLYL